MRATATGREVAAAAASLCGKRYIVGDQLQRTPVALHGGERAVGHGGHCGDGGDGGNPSYVPKPATAHCCHRPSSPRNHSRWGEQGAAARPDGDRIQHHLVRRETPSVFLVTHFGIPFRSSSPQPHNTSHHGAVGTSGIQGSAMEAACIISGRRQDTICRIRRSE
jgi:hypothetical protein